MQQELNTALSQLRELQDNLSELQKAHQVTQNQLRDKETINALIMSGLDAYCHNLGPEEAAFLRKPWMHFAIVL